MQANLLFRNKLPRLLLLALCLFGAAPQLFAEPGPFTTLRNTELRFPANVLLTNGVPGLTNPPSRMMVSSVASVSAQEGQVSLVSTQMWVQRYHGPVTAYEQALAVAVDPAGNVCVTGNADNSLYQEDFATLKYASDGTVLWTNHYLSSAYGPGLVGGLAVDAAGNVFVTGSLPGPNSSADVVTLKYASDGTGLWTNYYNWYGTNNQGPNGFAVDRAGNVLVLVSTIYGPSDYTVLKYSPSGQGLWTNHFQLNDDHPAALALDSSNNVFVIGNSYVPGADAGGITLKYAPDGRLLWTNYYFGGYGPLPWAIALDQQGNAIVVGDLMMPAHQYFTVKYDPAGVPLWTNVVGAPTYQGAGVPKVTVDLAGNVFLIGGSPGADSTNADYTTVKFSPSGLPLWTNRFFAPSNNSPAPGGTTVDQAGNVYLGGHANGAAGTNPAWLVLKLGANGIPVWTNHFSGSSSPLDSLAALTVDPAGNVYATGQSSGPLGEGYATVKYADQLVYRPPANFIGTDTFSFTATDDQGRSATGLASVVVSPPSLEFNTSSSGLRRTAGGFALEVDGAQGTNAVVIYASTNLVNWLPVYTNVPVLGSVQFIDPGATNAPRRFYRARQGQ